MWAVWIRNQTAHFVQSDLNYIVHKSLCVVIRKELTSRRVKILVSVVILYIYANRGPVLEPEIDFTWKESVDSVCFTLLGEILYQPLIDLKHTSQNSSD